MLRSLGTAGDRLLSRLVPRAVAAAAVHCTWQYASHHNPCVRRLVCRGPEIPGGVAYGSWQLC